MRFFKRANSFIKRVLWLKNFMPSFVHAILHLVTIKLFPKMMGEATYKNLPFFFYQQDMSAILEVLSDKEYKFLSEYITSKNSPVILDVGSNIGTFAIWTLGENKKSQILSIEPSEKTFETLSRNVNEAHKINYNWTCKKKAAWKNEDMIYFASDGESMGHKVLKTGNNKVQGITLEQIMNDHLTKTGADRIDLLKIDIEGAEESFLCGDKEKSKELLQKVERLTIELHPNYCDADNVLEFLKSTYKNIINQTDRVSQKPLLYCYN